MTPKKKPTLLRTEEQLDRTLGRYRGSRLRIGIITFFENGCPACDTFRGIIMDAMKDRGFRLFDFYRVEVTTRNQHRWDPVLDGLKAKAFPFTVMVSQSKMRRIAGMIDLPQFSDIRRLLDRARGGG